jgi:hypothetical protein
MRVRADGARLEQARRLKGVRGKKKSFSFS